MESLTKNDNVKRVPDSVKKMLAIANKALAFAGLPPKKDRFFIYKCRFCGGKYEAPQPRLGCGCREESDGARLLNPRYSRFPREESKKKKPKKQIIKKGRKPKKYSEEWIIMINNETPKERLVRLFKSNRPLGSSATEDDAKDIASELDLMEEEGIDLSKVSLRDVMRRVWG